MSGGISATTVLAGAAVAGAAVSAYGAVESGQAQQAAAGYNAQVAQNNAQIATQNARQAGAVGNENAAIEGAKTKAAVGGILASQGANNVDVNSGSAVDVRAGQAEAGMLNAQTIRSNAARQAYGFQTQSAAYTGQSAEDTYTGSQAATAGDIGAGADLLKGIGSAGKTAGGGGGGGDGGDGLLGGTPNTPAGNYAAQQAMSGSSLPTDVGGGYGIGTAIPGFQ